MTIPQQTTYPRAHAHITAHEVTLTLPDGSRESIRTGMGEDARSRIVMRMVAASASMNEAIEVTTDGIHGQAQIVVYPDGRAMAASDAPGSAPALVETVPMPEHSAPVVEVEPARLVEDATPAELDQPEPMGDASADAMGQPALRRDRRVSFIDTQEPIQIEPTSWWRRVGASFGIKVGPSEEDIERERCRRAVAMQWGSTRRIAVINGKGGVGKTTTDAMVAAVFGREGGGGVLALDNNPTRGSLGWRTESARHEATVQDVLAQAERLLDPAASRALIADFVHHQTDDRYDVLRSNPQLLAISQQINDDEFDLLMRIVDRSYRLVVFDSGNDESASRWLRMIDWSHQLIVPTTTSPESAESAILLLDELANRDEHSRQLAERALVVVLTTDPKGSPAAAAKVAAGFESTGVRVLHVPFDKALTSGPLRFGQLAEPTKTAWLRVAAAASESF